MSIFSKAYKYLTLRRERHKGTMTYLTSLESNSRIKELTKRKRTVFGNQEYFFINLCFICLLNSLQFVWTGI